MNSTSLIVTIDELDAEELQAACDAVVKALHEFSKPYKIGALHILMEQFPEKFQIVPSVGVISNIKEFQFCPKCRKHFGTVQERQVHFQEDH